MWNDLKTVVLAYTDNINCYPPISNIQILLGDIKSNSRKIKTAIWILAVFLQKFYIVKIDRKVPNFDSICILLFQKKNSSCDTRSV